MIEICQERALAIGSPEAAALSTRAMWLFQHSIGPFDEEMFYQTLRHG
ncbi:hypothetical protein ACVDG8_014645 [Mesorhizobium sp. ORM8.1]